jgi:hypothetical protein
VSEQWIPYRLIFGFFILLLFFGSCEKDAGQADLEYEYYPIAIGHSVTYKVDSIIIDSEAGRYDTAQYFIKEKIVEHFKDEEGRPSYRIKRFKKRSENAPWKVERVWYATRTATELQLVEDNLRFIKLVFPPEENKTWGGHNLLNAEVVEEQGGQYWCYPTPFDNWDYEYTTVGTPDTVNGRTYDTTLTVHQKVSGNLVDSVYFVEKYAKHIGMIYQKRFHKQKGLEDDWSDPSCANIKEMRIVDYSP